MLTPFVAEIIMAKYRQNADNMNRWETYVLQYFISSGLECLVRHLVIWSPISKRDCRSVVRAALSSDVPWSNLRKAFFTGRILSLHCKHQEINTGNWHIYKRISNKTFTDHNKSKLASGLDVIKMLTVVIKNIRQCYTKKWFQSTTHQMVQIGAFSGLLRLKMAHIWQLGFSVNTLISVQ